MSNTSEAASSARRINNALVEYRERLQADARALRHRQNALEAIRSIVRTADEAQSAVGQIEAIVEAGPESGYCFDCGRVFEAKNRPSDEPCPRCGHYRAWVRIS